MIKKVIFILKNAPFKIKLFIILTLRVINSSHDHVSRLGGHRPKLLVNFPSLQRLETCKPECAKPIHTHILPHDQPC